VEAFEAASEGLPVYLLDVISERALSIGIADRVGVRHASPQVILFQRDRPVWNASHGAILCEVLSERTAVEPEMP
jgi:bacillithiol system protein YtxJ